MADWVIPGGNVIPYLGAAGSVALVYGAELSELVFAGITLVLGVIVARLSMRRS